MTRVLVTGGLGFIGSNYVELCLVDTNIELVINVDKISANSNSRYCNVELPKYRHYCVDLNNRGALLRILKEHEIDTVVHFAALTHVDDSFYDPEGFVKSNITGTLSLLNAVKDYGKVGRFVHISTDEIYGDNRDGKAHLPESPTFPQNPYSATKAGAEAIARSFCESFKVPIVFVRANNNYGQYQYPDKVVGRFIRQLHESKPITIHGQGHVCRSFIHVSDCCRAVHIVLEKGEIGAIYNIGSADEIRIVDLAYKLKSMIESSSEIEFVKDRVKNDLGYKVDASMLTALGWEKQVSFDEGLTKTIEWYRDENNMKTWENTKYKYLVYGGKGWIGSMVVEYLQKQGHIVVVSDKRLEDANAIKEEVSSVLPSHVITTAGRTSGTGCVYLYDDKHTPDLDSPGFTEECTPNFGGSGYSYVKGFTDTLLNDLPGVLNCRIRMPIDDRDHPRNFITKIATYKKICSIPNSMTVLPEFIPIIVDMAKNRQEGTYNLTNPGRIEHNEILKMYKCYVNPHFTWENFTDEEQAKILAAPRSNNYLETSKIQKLYPELNNVHQAIEDVLKNYEKPN